jgi:hypothetical protein
MQLGSFAGQRHKSIANGIYTLPTCIQNTGVYNYLPDI